LSARIDDSRIDGVASAMTDAPAADDLSPRVLARIAQPDRRAWRKAWLLAPMGGVAVIMAFMSWPSREVGLESAPTREGSLAGNIAATGEAAGAQARPAADTPSGGSDGLPTGGPGHDGKTVASAVADMAPEGLTIAAIAAGPIEPLEPTTIGPLETIALSIAPLEIEAIGSQSE
jgi:hypothetical protein